MAIKPEYRDELCTTLLSELLAYQFTYPVRWIETQDIFLNDFKSERIIEVGPSPILTNMAKRTIIANEAWESANGSLLKRQVFCTSNHLEDIYYNGEQHVALDDKGSDEHRIREPEVQQIKNAVESRTTTSQMNATASSFRLSNNIELKPEHLIRAIISCKLPGAKYCEIDTGKSIKELSQGKSTVQNEIKGDLIKEFGSIGEDNIEDIPLRDVCFGLEAKSMGAVVLPQVMKYISKNFIGRFASLKNLRSYLSQEWCMSDPNPFLVYLAYAKSIPDKKTSSDAEAKEYIDKCCYNFAASEKVSVICSEISTQDSNVDDEEKRTISIEEFELFNDELQVMNSQQNKIYQAYSSSNVKTSEFNSLKQELQVMKDRFSVFEKEFGSAFLNESINVMFSPKKVRSYSSSWNWVRQDILDFASLYLNRDIQVSATDIKKKIKNISNRADTFSLRMLEYQIKEKCQDERWKQLLRLLLDECKKSIKLGSTYTSEFESVESQPERFEKLELDDRIHLEQYIKTISLGKGNDEVKESCSVVSTKLDTDVSSYYKIETELFQVYSKIIQYALASTNANPADMWGQFKSLYEQLLIFLKNSDQIASYFRAIVTDALSAINKPLYSKSENILVEDYAVDSSSDDDDSCNTSDDDEYRSFESKKNETLPCVSEKHVDKESCTIPVGVIPFLHIKRHSNTNENWVYDKKYTQVFLNNLLNIGYRGINLSGKTALLLTPQFSNEFVHEIIIALLQAGTTVLVATNDFQLNTTKSLQDVYHKHGAKGSKLIVLPINYSSKVDIQDLCDHIYSTYDDIDYLLPLNTPRLESSVIEINSQDELQMRSSILNVQRLLGNIVRAKKKMGNEVRPTFVLLPLSPTTGSKPANGFLSESYSSLNKLLDMWHVEDWKNQISLCGCVYGWTIDSQQKEMISTNDLDKLGIRTFSAAEMAFNVLGLLTYDIVSLSQNSPIVADLNGGLHTLPNVMPVLNAMRQHALEEVSIKEMIAEEKSQDDLTKVHDVSHQFGEISPIGNPTMKFPALLEYSQLREKFNGTTLNGLVDPCHLVVVTGFAEVGPWGNARTRWEMESKGVFSLEGCIEMAWIMGMIKYKESADYCGWIDVKTNSPVQGVQIKELFEPTILKHSGIRIIEPELFCGYNPSKRQMLQEVALNYDLSPVRTSAELAEQYKLEQGDRVNIVYLDDGECMVQFLKGATMYIPKALDVQRMVAGQIPKGWDAHTYGLPDDIVSQVDPITLFALVSTAEALISSGISDPYEMYKYVHVSEVGNCVGAGIGGLKSMHEMQLLRTKGEMIQNDILPETFINITAAWINMLLLSSSGPIKTPVGACATAVESLENGYETIKSGKAKICIVGGVDDFHEALSHEFANMGATSNSTEEFERGRDPKEMCRPATSSRNGFMESQGAGVQILMRGDLAIKMGAPIYGVIGMTSTASDKISKSLPAPGKGILTCARESKQKPKFGIPKLNINYRKRQLEFRENEIKKWAEEELLAGSPVELVHELTEKQILEAKSHWGIEFWKNDPNISPLKGSLSVFGLSIDELDVVSCHGTSTKANEKNESDIINTMMDYLGRTEGNPVMAVYQKHLTGHPKGAAGAWMMNGCLQIMNDSIIPGNRNADDIDGEFEKFKHLVFPSSTLHVDTVKACMLTSFGFGQKGAMALVLNPNFLFSCLTEDEYSRYNLLRNKRERIIQNKFVETIIHNNVVQIKEEPPYTKNEEKNVYLDPLIRF